MDEATLLAEVERDGERAIRAGDGSQPRVGRMGDPQVSQPGRLRELPRQGGLSATAADGQDVDRIGHAR